MGRQKLAEEGDDDQVKLTLRLPGFFMFVLLLTLRLQETIPGHSDTEPFVFFQEDEDQEEDSSDSDDDDDDDDEDTDALLEELINDDPENLDLADSPADEEVPTDVSSVLLRVSSMSLMIISVIGSGYHGGISRVIFWQ